MAKRICWIGERLLFAGEVTPFFVVLNDSQLLLVVVLDVEDGDAIGRGGLGGVGEEEGEGDCFAVMGTDDYLVV